eukprot:198356_1
MHLSCRAPHWNLVIPVLVLVAFTVMFHILIYHKTNMLIQNYLSEHQPYVNSILDRMDKIDIHQQLARNQEIYKQIFPDLDMNIIDSFTQYFSSTQPRDKCILLTPMVFSDPNNIDGHGLQHMKSQKEYDFQAMRYAYDSKLKYAQFHSYIFIIDTFNYLSFFNISRTESYLSPTVSQLNKMTISKEFNATALHAWGHSYYKGSFNASSQRFKITVRIPIHYNKILSDLYWSKHSNCILHLDDDAWIGNYKLPITYWIDINQFAHPLLVLPYDNINGNTLQFSNFAYILYHKYNSSALDVQKFLLKWWGNRVLPFPNPDQTAMYHAIASHLLDDQAFLTEYVQTQPESRINLFWKATQFCKVVPIWAGCTRSAFDVIRFKRPRTADVLHSKTNISIFWTPLVQTSWKYLSEHGNLTGYEYDVYPFSLNLNWGAQSQVFRSLYLLDKQGLTNQEWFHDDENQQKLSNVFDETYILHYRHRSNNMFQNVISNMTISTNLNVSVH